MRKDWRDFARHIVEAIDRIHRYREQSRLGEVGDDIATDAILRNLETIAEAASGKIPDAVKDQFPLIDWKGISGMRVRLAHAYLSIDRSVVEATIENDLPALRDAMARLISDRDREKDR